MQEGRRGFAKKLAMLAGVGVATVGLAKTEKMMPSNQSSLSNGVVIGTSRKKEILYHQTLDWEEYYKTAK